MKKICYVIPNMEKSGAETQLYNLITSLPDRFKVYLIVLRNKNDFDFSKKVQVYFMNLRFASLGGNLIAFIKVCILLRKIKPDIIHTFLGTANKYGALYSYIFKFSQLIISFRSIVDKKYVTFFSTKINWLLKKSSKYVVVNSKAGKDAIIDVLKYNKETIKFIPNGVDFSELDNVNKTSSDYIRFLVPARIYESKNQLTVVNAVNYISKNYPNTIKKIKIVLKGENSDKKYYDNIVSLIEKNMLNEFISLSNPERVKRKLYKKTDVVILPSLYEGLSNVLLEAMYLNIPIICSKEADSDNMLVGIGKMFSAKNYVELANCIVDITEKLVNSSIKVDTKSIIKNGYTIDKMVSRTVKLYEK